MSGLVTETFFALAVFDMKRATRFYVEALGATVAFATPQWSSLHVAGVRVGLALGGAPGPSGLHFAVRDLLEARAAIARCGGRAGEPLQVADGITLVEAHDTEGNGFTLRG